MTETSRPEPYAAAPAQPSNGGRAAIIFAGIVVLLGLTIQVVSQLLPYIMQWLGLGVEQVFVLFLPMQLASVIAAVLAIVLAIRPLTGQGPKALAGAAAGIGVASLISSLVALVLPLVISLTQ